MQASPWGARMLPSSKSVIRNSGNTIAWNWSSQTFAETPTTPDGGGPPELLSRMSIWPSSLRAPLAAASRLVQFARSAAKPTALTPRAEISETAQHQYGVTFPIAAKATVKGPNAHPFYKWAAEARPKDVPHWNFHKYLIGRDGYIAETFPETVEPSDTRVKTAIGRALGVT